LTEAILARRMVHDPDLREVSAVILDEFHERHLATDLALALLKGVRASNPKLKIIVMSATLEGEPVAAFLGDTPCISVPGSPFDVLIEYEERPSERPLHEKIVSAVSRSLRDRSGGDILVFLPGSREIRRSEEALRPLADQHGLLVLPLHGDLPGSEQSRAVEPAEHRKVILSTNVSETSVTIPGIGAVIDSGLVRMAGHSPWSGFPTLSTVKTSKASAIQRAGRAGRTQAGRVLRLYTLADFESRPEYATPEIKRADLTETVLLLHGSGIRDPHSFPWFDAPPKSALEAAEKLLRRLGALDTDGNTTPVGKQMLSVPVHPRLARLILEGSEQKVAGECTLLAALLSERDIRLATRAKFGSGPSRRDSGASGESDLIEMLDDFHNAEAVHFEPSRVLSLGMDPGAVQAVCRAHRQLQRLGASGKSDRTASEKEKKEGILISILTAFPDRVVKRRKEGSRELLLAGGGTAMLASSSVVHHPMLAVAVEAEERREAHRNESSVVIRLASSIEVEWLAVHCPENLAEKKELTWNDSGRRVDDVRRTSFEQIVIEERVSPASPSGEASKVLETAVWSRKLSDFPGLSSLPDLQARISLAARYFPEERFPEIGDSAIREAVEILCRGKSRLDELANISLTDCLLSRLTKRQKDLLGREVPERVRLTTGRWVKIHYETSQPPWIESRLQDFFGVSESPAICNGHVPITVHLLAPNGRAVQVTTDLAGFWKRHYGAIRKELQRRYPKHSWPDL
jgi:ATP-dependent helicase HrpB